MYSSKIKFQQQFDGKLVKATLRQLSFEDGLAVRAIDVSKISDKDERSKEEMVELIRILGPRIKDYVIEFDGPIDADGSPVPIEEVTRVLYFTRLVGGMCAALMDESVPPREPASASDS